MGTERETMYNKMKFLLGGTLLNAMNRADLDGCLITARGFFEQGLLKNPEDAARHAFVLAQTREQREKIKDKILEGRAYEIGRYALVAGSIDANRLVFGKMYDPKSVKDPQRAREIIKRVGEVLKRFGEHIPEYDSIVNPDLITYQGERLDLENESELVYKGKWDFKHSKLDDLATEGSFMVHIANPEVVKMILEQK